MQTIYHGMTRGRQQGLNNAMGMRRLRNAEDQTRYGREQDRIAQDRLEKQDGIAEEERQYRRGRLDKQALLPASQSRRLVGVGRRLAARLAHRVANDPDKNYLWCRERERGGGASYRS